MVDKDKMVYVPIEVATTPAEGHCFVNRWWAVHPEKGIAFYWNRKGYYRMDEPAPQCNANERTARLLHSKLYPGWETVFLPAVYLAHAIRNGRKKAA